MTRNISRVLGLQVIFIYGKNEGVSLGAKNSWSPSIVRFCVRLNVLIGVVRSDHV